MNHVDDKGHLPDWDNVKTLIKGKDKKERKAIEALYIATNKNNNKRTGDIVWSPIATGILMKKLKIPDD